MNCIRPLLRFDLVREVLPLRAAINHTEASGVVFDAHHAREFGRPFASHGDVGFHGNRTR